MNHYKADIFDALEYYSEYGDGSPRLFDSTDEDYMPQFKTILKAAKALVESDEYNEGFAHGHACAWEQAICAQEADINALMKPVGPQCNYSPLEYGEVTGFNDCLEFLKANGYRIVK